MPLLKLENISPEASWGLWKIDEDTTKAAKALPRVDHGVQYYHPIKQLEYYASRLLLGELCKMKDIEAFAVAKDEFGKPYLPGMAAHISLSHSYPYAVAMLNLTEQCGIDIEKISEKPLRVAKKFLNDEEMAWVGDNQHLATLVWTAKEAMYKHYGRKKLSFKEDLSVSEAQVFPPNHLEGCMIENDKKSRFQLEVRYFDGHIITLTL